MKKIIIASVLAVSVVISIGVVFANDRNANDRNSCGYDENGNFHSQDGTVSAFGTMDDALACASQGILPEVVVNRLGIWGDDAIKKWASEIKMINIEARKKNEEAKQ
jgi:hypothetical protein